MSKDSDDDSEKWILVNAFFAVEVSLVEEVRRVIAEIVPALWHSVNYTAEELCGPDLWVERYPGRHRELGMIVSYCARHDLLPLECSVCKHQYPKLYRLK